MQVNVTTIIKVTYVVICPWSYFTYLCVSHVHTRTHSPTLHPYFCRQYLLPTNVWLLGKTQWSQ